jgi:hypothetical protein
MQNLAPIPRDARPALPEFAPVPRLYRHDGWTPARQKAFIEALADTGSVTRAAGMVNMAQANCYTLRRAPGAEEFRRAWEAALDFGVQRLKDIAFERAIDGQLVPVFVAGKLMGYQRKRNDALLMFCLRHYGQDASGKRTTINYFSSKASAGTSAGSGGGAEASTTTVRTVINGEGGGSKIERDDSTAALLNSFDGVSLDPQAEAAIKAALEDFASRHREDHDKIKYREPGALVAQMEDTEVPFVRVLNSDSPFWGEMEPESLFEDCADFIVGEHDWRMAGAEIPEMYHEVHDAFQAANPRVISPQIADVKKRLTKAGETGTLNRDVPD